MSRGVQASELRMQLCHELVGRLAGDGWTPVAESHEQKLVLVRLLRPLVDGFEATAEVDLVSTVSDRPPVRVSDLRLGVAYEPLRRLSPLLGDRFARALLVTNVRNAPASSASPWLEVGSRRDAIDVAEALAALILERAIPYAEQYASLEALLAALEAPVDPDGVDIRVPALLAAAGRFDDAAAALERYHPPDAPGYFVRQDRRTAYQLGRWVSSHGDESLLPDNPPPSRLDDERPNRSSARTWAESKARREAIEEVRRGGRGRERDEVRTLLREALARRGLMESPLSLEATLDHLWDTPAERVRLGVQTLRAMGRFGRGVMTAIREHELPDISPPDWLEPPDPAFYEVPRANRWTLVTLPPGVDAWLDRVHEAARPRVFGVASVDAWLKPETDGSEVGVYVGEQRVGVIPDDAIDAYRPVLEAAGFRKELPCLPGRLAQRGQPPSYMLEIALPK